MAKDSARTAAEQTRAAVALSTEDSATAAFAAAAVGQAVAAPGSEPASGSGQRLKVRERLAYGVGDIGGNLIFAPISAFLLFYFTDTVGIGAAIAGTLLLFGLGAAAIGLILAAGLSALAGSKREDRPQAQTVKGS